MLITLIFYSFQQVINTLYTKLSTFFNLLLYKCR
uniref:Uncharacterized protein n=1 Tax=Siphoviridae sp. ct6GI21 TaxID=2825340 RepID=A0A8S5U463_9CAUD|nr:MAG TPA: hypothetical protein [Siphoviridae sp. ct6GI21]